MRVGRPETVTAEVADRRRRVPWLVDVWRSQLGKKYAIAVTGLILFAWIFAHMIGGLKFFQGPEHYNEYSEWLRTMGEPAAPRTLLLWTLRTVLLASTVIHVVASVQLTLINRRARQRGYREVNYVAANYAARTMRWSGVIVLLFTAYHLLDLTWGHANPDFIPRDVYHNTVATMSVWPLAGVYIVANVVLGVHLYHGLWSLFQSMGWNAPRFNHWRNYFAYTFAVVVTLGFISVPIAVLAGVGR